MATIDLRTQSFGKWYVVGALQNYGTLEGYWLCQCACGTLSNPLHGGVLVAGNARSCG